MTRPPDRGTLPWPVPDRTMTPVYGDDLFGLIALTVAVSAIPIAALVRSRAREAEHRRRLRLEGRPVMAHVSSLGYDPGDGLVSGSYWATVRYEDGRDLVTTRVSISQGEYRSYRVGTGVLVTYLPGQPASARRPELQRAARPAPPA